MMCSVLILTTVVIGCQSAVINVESDSVRRHDYLLDKLQDTVDNDVQTFRSNDTWPPAFCNQLQCPKFSVIKSTKDYEVRRYSKSRWVSTELSSIDYDTAIYKMFMKLFLYISGNNKKGEKIDMTAPVANMIQPGQGPACESYFKMSFFIADKVKTPPKPSDKTVYLNTFPEMTVYVRSFGGFATQADYTREGKALAEALPDSAKYYKLFYFTAGYDSPAKLRHRHNEVWFISTK